MILKRELGFVFISMMFRLYRWIPHPPHKKTQNQTKLYSWKTFFLLCRENQKRPIYQTVVLQLIHLPCENLHKSFLAMYWNLIHVTSFSIEIITWLKTIGFGKCWHWRHNKRGCCTLTTSRCYIVCLCFF